MKILDTGIEKYCNNCKKDVQTEFHVFGKVEFNILIVCSELRCQKCGTELWSQEHRHEIY